MFINAVRIGRTEYAALELGQEKQNLFGDDDDGIGDGMGVVGRRRPVEKIACFFMDFLWVLIMYVFEFLVIVLS